MNKLKSTIFWGCVGLSLILLSSTLSAKPKYASDQTKEVIEAMVKAHGGIDKWRAAPAISFDAIMHNNYHGKNELAWWVARETIDLKTKQVYQDWFIDDAEIAFDGKDVWSRNWRKSNPPTAMLYFFYYFVNLPFLTQEDGVILSEVSDFEWPGHGGRKYHEVKMTFKEKPTIGKSALDYFVLYIDKESNLLVGYQYAIGNKAFLNALGLPPEKKLFGPLWRVITKHQTVDGLVFPAAFRTMPQADAPIAGNHIVTNIDLNTPLDKTKLRKPESAVIDSEGNR